jgi:hypothetical protein
MDSQRLHNLCELSPFTTRLEAMTDVHAGPNVFCVLYRRELVFHPNHEVELNYRIVDNWRPLDDEAERLLSRSCRGTLSPGGRLKISFPNMDFYGAEYEKRAGLLVFHVSGRIEYSDDIKRLMGGDVSSLPTDFTESIVFSSKR